MKQDTIKILEQYGQKHILNYLPILTEEEQEKLEEQISKIDFEQLITLYKDAKQAPSIEQKKLEHIESISKANLSKEKRKELEQIGRKVIKDGHYAVITMAGGQGTRLGHNGPKGSYVLNTKNGTKYIFEIIIDTLKKAKIDYGVTIPWYVMTSRENHKATISFLEEHNYFGYDKTKVIFFTQGELPLVDTNGKVIFDKEKRIKEAADGNGGIYHAVNKSGLLEEMKKNNIEWICVSNVDNILSNFVDPLILGLTIEKNTKIGAKSLEKVDPKEKVGVFCKMNGKPKIIEYIDLPEEMAEARNEDGKLVYSEVYFGSCLFNRSVFENLEEAKLPLHAAFKKVGYLNEKGNYIEPSEPNVYKFEAFIFDAFERYNDITILRVERNEEFAPVKNSTGNDSPETAVKLYNAIR